MSEPSEPVEPSSGVGVDGPDARALELLQALLLLPPDVADRIRGASPRRRTRRPQTGPGLDLGADT
ncbi:hypothetical protein [Jatrophihabitans endophyticus]|uniref:hypothetical protein n=1 Tax=Jatrophihabitans endophyticus TaxID=1206085 RepID=UPI0019F556C3|nr:hypothetical protein [Jatrophihabitans endophyticus]MBE7190313.1 hypothetical protein [Jatrophihabitans endophyticus]